MNKLKAGSAPSFADIASKVGHISSKTVNTNVFTGVRYAAEDAVCLPYVSVRSMLAVPGISLALMDYQGNAALSRYAKNLLGIADAPLQNLKTKSVKNPAATAGSLLKDKSSVPDCPLEDRERINYRALIGEQHAVNARLRQVLLPLQNDEYVSVTPLESSGLSALLRSRIQTLIDAKNEIPTWRRPRLASMPIGGSKPQNVGVRVRDMACLFVKTPTANFAVQSAVRAAFNGIRVLPAAKLLYQWRDSGQLASLCAGLSNRADKDLFLESVRPLARNVLKRAGVAFIQVQALLEREPEDGREEAWAEIEAQLGFVQFGFLKPESRSPRWAERAAWAITNAIDRWLIQYAQKRDRSGSGDDLILTASAKTVLVNALATELT